MTFLFSILLTIFNVFCLLLTIYLKFFKPNRCSHTFEHYNKIDITDNGHCIGFVLINRCTKCGRFENHIVKG